MKLMRALIVWRIICVIVVLACILGAIWIPEHRWHLIFTAALFAFLSQEAKDTVDKMVRKASDRTAFTSRNTETGKWEPK